MKAFDYDVTGWIDERMREDPTPLLWLGACAVALLFLLNGLRSNTEPTMTALPVEPVAAMGAGQAPVNAAFCLGRELTPDGVLELFAPAMLDDGAAGVLGVDGSAAVLGEYRVEVDGARVTVTGPDASSVAALQHDIEVCAGQRQETQPPGMWTEGMRRYEPMSGGSVDL